MNPKTYRTLQILILVSLGIFLAQKLISGSLYYYINQRFFGLVWFGVAGFLFLAFILFRARGEGGRARLASVRRRNDRSDQRRQPAAWATRPYPNHNPVSARPTRSMCWALNSDCSAISARPATVKAPLSSSPT